MDQPVNQPINRMADRERPKRIDELLWRAMELEGEALAEFLDRACEGDAELRRELESRLGDEVDTREILKHSPAALWRQRDQEDALRAGEKIRHYRIESRIGRGGMGEVYLARDEHLPRQVAIKILPPEFSADAKRVRRFEQEARTVSTLNHPNIITIFDIIHDGGNHFIVTEFVDGETLRQAINDGRLSLPQKLTAAIQIAEALSVAHEAGIVHRDI
ncbi:MAG: serine/threonine-protein kinase, partial [Blastocatellia bacterium]